MDEQGLPKSASGIAVPLVPEQGACGNGSMLVFFGDPARVSEGFAMALHAMGTGVSMMDVVVSDPSGQEK